MFCSVFFFSGLQLEDTDWDGREGVAAGISSHVASMVRKQRFMLMHHSLSSFYSSSWGADAHTQGESSHSSSMPLMYPEVCILGDSTSSQVDNRY